MGSRILLTQTDKLLYTGNSLQFANSQTEAYHYLNEAKSIISRNKITKTNIITKRKKKMHSSQGSQSRKISKKEIMPAVQLTNSLITSYPYLQDFNYPITMGDWPQIQTPLFSVQPLPVIIPTQRSLLGQHITPMVPLVQPLLSPILPQTYIQDVTNLNTTLPEYSFATEQIDELSENFNNTLEIVDTSKCNKYNTSTEIKSNDSDVMESYYMKLPKELFPSPNMLHFDPNPLIDEFCKMSNVQKHLPWLLDLEFGVPKCPITRPIPTYNVKFNSIHCKNAPEAIHPGFESCEPDFKKHLLFYYDSIVSAWYKGYIIMHSDRSVENFQSWLQWAMQDLGMCWP